MLLDASIVELSGGSVKRRQRIRQRIGVLWGSRGLEGRWSEIKAGTVAPSRLSGILSSCRCREIGGARDRLGVSYMIEYELIFLVDHALRVSM